MSVITVVEEGWVNINGTDYSVSENPIFDDLYQLIYENGSRKRVIVKALNINAEADHFSITGDKYILDDGNWVKLKEQFITIAEKNQYRNLETGEIVSEEVAKTEGELNEGFGNSSQYYIYNLKPVFEPIFSGAIKRKLGIND